jgi:hypothetical protein
VKKIVGAILLLALMASSASGQIKAADGIDLGTSTTPLSSSGRAKIRFNGTNIEASLSGAAWTPLGGATWPLQNGTSTNTYRSAITDSAAAVGHAFDTLNAFNTAGDKLISIRNAGTEKLNITNVPGVETRITASEGNAYLFNGANNTGFGATSLQLTFYANSARAVLTASELRPQTDNSLTLGTGAFRFSTVYTPQVNAGSGDLTLIDGTGIPRLVLSNGNGTLLYYNTSLIKVGGSSIDIAPGGTNAFSIYGVSVRPTDDAVSLGIASNRWQQILQGHNGIGTAQYVGISLTNNTPAAATAPLQQSSPAILLEGRGWDSVALASKPVGWLIQNRPVQQALDPSADLVFYLQRNAGTPVEQLSIRTLNVSGSAVGVMLAHTSGTGLDFQASESDVIINGAVSYYYDTNSFNPWVDNARNIGQAARRFATTYTTAVNSGVLTLTATTTVATGASRAGFIFNDTNNVAVTDKVMDLQIGGASKGAFKYHPLGASLFGWQSVGDTFFIDASQNGFTVQGGVTYFYAGGTVRYQASATTLAPFADNSGNLGDITHRYSTTNTFAVNSGASGMTFTTTVAGGGARAGFTYLDTSNDLSQGNKFIAIGNTANGERIAISDTITVFSAGQYTMRATNGMCTQAGTGVQLCLDAAKFAATNSDNVLVLGDASHRWQNVFSYGYSGRTAASTGSGAVSISPVSVGEHLKLTATGNITSINLNTSQAAQIITLVLVQDAAGTSTWPTTIANCKFAGGTFVKTLAANAVDTYTLRYDDGTGVYREIGRAVNVQ